MDLRVTQSLPLTTPASRGTRKVVATPATRATRASRATGGDA
jgi:hypothetical protein